MIMGVGIDMVRISRLTSWLEDEKICARYFQAKEMEIIRSRAMGSVSSLATRFAAKEAFIKALGRGFRNISLKEIAVLNDRENRPCIVPEGWARKAMVRLGAVKAHVSLTHEGDHAIANVIIEG